MSDSKTCTFKIYVDRPSAKRPGGDALPKDMTGHVFIGLVDSYGNERIVGFYARALAEGNENVPESERVQGLPDAFKKVSGYVKDDSFRRYDDVQEYKITEEQYAQMMAMIDSYEKLPPRYVLATHNCVTFACRIAEAGGVKPPLQLYVLDSPAGTAAAISLGKGWDRMKSNAGSALSAIRRWFGGPKLDEVGPLGETRPLSPRERTGEDLPELRTPPRNYGRLNDSLATARARLGRLIEHAMPKPRWA